MIRTKSIKTFAIFLLFGIFSCKQFLDVDPPSSKIPKEVVFSSDDLANSALAGIYLDIYANGQGKFASGGTTSLASLTGLSSDELHLALQVDPDISSFEDNNLIATNPLVTGLWSSMYRAIYQANVVLESLSVSPGITAGKKNQFIGEALFIRAFCHFYLVNVFGDVPILITTDYKISSKAQRMPKSDVYSQIEADLLVAEMLLPDSYLNGKRIRPVKAVATALLSRFYLYKKDWSKAEANATKIISNIMQYKLEDDLDKVFLSGSQEAIWQLKPADNVNLTNEGLAFSPDVALSNSVLSGYLVSSFLNIDKRKTFWIVSEGTVYLPYKYKVRTSIGQSSSEYSMVFRLAEQYLIRAEARAWQGLISGNNSAESDINIIRHRAGLPHVIINSQSGAINEVESERKWELFTEWGHRWFDLKRWDRSSEVLAPIKPRWTINDLLYPIPREEMNKNTYLTPQNPGYE